MFKSLKLKKQNKVKHFFFSRKKGFSNGIIIEISNLISLFLAIYIGVNFSQLIYPYLKTEILSDYSNIVPLIAFLIVFIIAIVWITESKKKF